MYNALGVAAPTLEKCFYKLLFNLTLKEVERKMAGEQHQYLVLLQKAVSQLSEITEGLKKLALSDLNVSAGSQCMIASVRCLDPHFAAVNSLVSRIFSSNYITAIKSFFTCILGPTFYCCSRKNEANRKLCEKFENVQPPSLLK